jgi:hypothetical protein
MVQVLRLSRIAGTAPPHFRVVFRGSELASEAHFGSEQDIRKLLVKGGVSTAEVDRLFRLTTMDSGKR